MLRIAAEPELDSCRWLVDKFKTAVRTLKRGGSSTRAQFVHWSNVFWFGQLRTFHISSMRVKPTESE